MRRISLDTRARSHLLSRVEQQRDARKAFAASASKALELLYHEPERVERLRVIAALFRCPAKERGLNVGASVGTAVAPIIAPGALSVIQLSKALFEHAISVQPVIYPAVPADGRRLRFLVTTGHNDGDIHFAIATTAEQTDLLDPHVL